MTVHRHPRNIKGQFLAYITSLSLELYSFVETITNYLLIHQHTTTISDSIKEIKIYSIKKIIKIFFTFMIG